MAGNNDILVMSMWRTEDILETNEIFKLEKKKLTIFLNEKYNEFNNDEKSNNWKGKNKNGIIFKVPTSEFKRWYRIEQHLDDIIKTCDFYILEARKYANMFINYFVYNSICQINIVFDPDFYYSLASENLIQSVILDNKLWFRNTICLQKLRFTLPWNGTVLVFKADNIWNKLKKDINEINSRQHQKYKYTLEYNEYMCDYRLQIILNRYSTESTDCIKYVCLNIFDCLTCCYNRPSDFLDKKLTIPLKYKQLTFVDKVKLTAEDKQKIKEIKNLFH